MPQKTKIEYENELKNVKSLLVVEEEKKNFIFNIMGLFFSLIPFLINLNDKFGLFTGTVTTALVPINALGVFTIGNDFKTTLEKLFKSIPPKDTDSYIQNVANTIFLVIYGCYIIVVPTCFFIGIENTYITYFSFFALGLKILQSVIYGAINLGNIVKFAKKITK